MAPGGGDAATSPAAQAVKRAARDLLEAAKSGLEHLAERTEARAAELGDLACAQCGSLLFEPTTLEDGVTVCQPCARKRREAVAAARGPVEERLPSWASEPEAFGFGQSPSVVLTELTQRCSPAAHAAAAARQRANAFFGKGELAEAATAYSDAIAGSPCADVALHCNRSVTRLKLGEVAGAVEDAVRAVALCRRMAPAGGESCPMWAKAWFRLGQALLAAGERSMEAAFALATSAAGSPGQPLLPQLLEAASALLRLEAEATAAEGANAPGTAAQGTLLSTVRGWLLEGSCPGLEAAAADQEEPASLQLRLFSPDGSEDPGHEEWVRQQLECALCLGLLFEPSTLPCGHTLCRPCLARSLDHAFEAAPACPMCRRDLAPYLTWINARAVVAAKASGGLVAGHGGAQIPVSRTLDKILRRHFEAETQARRAQIAREEAAAGDGGDREGAVVPIFICSLAMPAVACNLHIFEPRYRLMMRRCLESGQRQFGMCLNAQVEYGTMLHISGFEQLPDGRSRVQTVGTRRFRVLQWGEKDGYATGRVAWVDDDSEVGAGGCDEEDGLQEEISPAVVKLKCIVQGVLNFCLRIPAEEEELQWEHGRPQALEKIEAQLGTMPEADCRGGRHCPAYVFWCISLANAALGLPYESMYELCYGAEYRSSAAKRAEGMLEFYRQRISSPEAAAAYHARTGCGSPQEPPPCAMQ